MNRFKHRVGVRVLGIHAGIVFVVVLVPFLRGCFVPKPREIVTFFEVAEALPSVVVEARSHLSDPPRDPAPPPEPEPAPVPDPPQVREPQPIPRPKPTPPPSEKPNWKPTPVDPTKSTRVEASKQPPALTDAEIRQAFDDLRETPARPRSNPDQNAAYDAQVHSVFMSAWHQPAVAGARPARVKISFTGSGYITGRDLVQKSGDATFDQSVLDTVQRVSTLPKPPAGYPANSVIIQFRLD